MAEDLAVTLEDQIQETTWDALVPHHRRGALVWVDQALDLADIGARMAANDAVSVERLLKIGKLVRPSEEDAKTWAADKTKRFLFLIVQPFVLFQESRLH